MEMIALQALINRPTIASADVEREKTETGGELSKINVKTVRCIVVSCVAFRKVCFDVSRCPIPGAALCNQHVKLRSRAHIESAIC
jgi:hypothetical protein